MKFTIFATLLTFALLIAFTVGSAIPNLNPIPETDDNLPHSPDTETESNNNNLLGNNLLTRATLSAHKMLTTRKFPGISGNDDCGGSYEPVCNKAGETSTNSFLAFVGGLLRMGILF